MAKELSLCLKFFIISVLGIICQNRSMDWVFPSRTPLPRPLSAFNLERVPFSEVCFLIPGLPRERQEVELKKMLKMLVPNPEELLRLALIPWSGKVTYIARISPLNHTYCQELQQALQRMHRVEEEQGTQKFMVDLRAIEIIMEPGIRETVEARIKKEFEVRMQTDLEAQVAREIAKKQRWFNRHPLKLAAGTCVLTFLVCALLSEK